MEATKKNLKFQLSLSTLVPAMSENDINVLEYLQVYRNDTTVSYNYL